MVASSLGFLEPPEPMRLPEKFATLGLEMDTPIARGIMLIVGLGKCFIPINAFLLRSRLVNIIYAAVSIPGFALVLYAHRMISNPDPWVQEIAVILAPVAFVQFAIFDRQSIKPA